MHATVCLAEQKVDVEVGEECRTLHALKEIIVEELPQLCVEGFDVSVGGRALDDDEGVLSLEESVWTWQRTPVASAFLRCVRLAVRSARRGPLMQQTKVMWGSGGWRGGECRFFGHVARHHNQQADHVANKAMNSYPAAPS